MTRQGQIGMWKQNGTLQRQGIPIQRSANPHRLTRTHPRLAARKFRADNTDLQGWASPVTRAGSDRLSAFAEHCRSLHTPKPRCWSARLSSGPPTHPETHRECVFFGVGGGGVQIGQIDRGDNFIHVRVEALTAVRRARCGRSPPHFTAFSHPHCCGSGSCVVCPPSGVWIFSSPDFRKRVSSCCRFQTHTEVVKADPRSPPAGTAVSRRRIARFVAPATHLLYLPLLCRVVVASRRSEVVSQRSESTHKF